MNEVMKTLLSHSSIRSYLDKPVSEEHLEQIIKAVQAAPNWVNIQHVSIVSIKDIKHRKIFASLCGNQKHIEEAPIFLVFCADYYRTHLVCKTKNQSIDKVLKDIDNLIVGSHEVGIALGTAVVAAESLGLGTVVIGDIRLNALEVIKELNLPKYVIPILGLCIGYSACNPGLKPRLPKEAIYFEEIYNHNLYELIEEYDKTYAKYLKERSENNRISNWTELVTDFYCYPYNHYPEISKMLIQQAFAHDKR
ncbi:NADPH-dependent oxidoreductase [Clostridioides difficile]